RRLQGSALRDGLPVEQGSSWSTTRWSYPAFGAPKGKPLRRWTEFCRPPARANPLARREEGAVMSATCFEAVIDLDRGRAAGRAAEHSGGGVIDAAFDTLGTMMFIERNAEIFSDEEPADYVYRVVSGTVRCCKF